MVIYTNADKSQFKKVIVDTTPCDLNDAYEHLREQGFAFYPSQDASDDNSDLSSLIDAINSLPLKSQIKLANHIYSLEQKDDAAVFYDMRNLQHDREKVPGNDDEFKTEFITGKNGILKPLNRLYYEEGYSWKYPSDFSSKLTEVEIYQILNIVNLDLPNDKWHFWKIPTSAQTGGSTTEYVYAWIYDADKLPINVNQSLIDDGKSDYFGDSWDKQLKWIINRYPLYEIINCDSSGQNLTDSYRNVIKAVSSRPNTINDPELNDYMWKMYHMTPIKS